MVKRQKEKQYLSSREQRDYQANRSGYTASGLSGTNNKLPFSHCALSLQPYQTPVCNAQGVLFDKDQLVAFVWKHGKDPVTGEAMTLKDMIQLEMARDEETGAWQCPILQKTLGDHVKVVAIRQRKSKDNMAHVYSFQAYHELNVKAKNYTDLTTGEPFDKKKDVMILNDPDNEEDQQKKRNIAQFYHIQHERELRAGDEDNTNKNTNIRHSMTASRVLDKLQKNKDKKRGRDEGGEDDNNKSTSKKQRPSFTGNIISIKDPSNSSNTMQATVLAKDVTGVAYNQAAGAASFTSTGASLSLDAQERPATQQEMLQAQFGVMKNQLKRQKGRVRMTLQRKTKDDDTIQQEFSITLELDCDIAPRTCTNFLGLCATNKYNGCDFHRIIPRFMMQGGKAVDKDDDTSIWGEPFRDEFDPRLNHDGPGILSSANAGPHTNQRQFFITFASCPHLDKKHSVFGRVVRGMEHIKEIEREVTTDKQDRPKHERIVIAATQILENPAQTALDMERERLTEILVARYFQKKNKAKTKPLGGGTSSSTTASGGSSSTGGVGKYLRDRLKQQKASASKKKTAKGDSQQDEQEEAIPRRLPPPPKKTKFQNFSGW